jgi:XTP/dITP diphosphohydrolase
VEELRTLLGPEFDILSLADLPGAPEIKEDADSFAGNATKKAVGLAVWLSAVFPLRTARRFYVLADDSGLEVDALGGAPGVVSARFAALDTNAAENATDLANNAKLLRLMRSIPPDSRAARFRCVIAVTEVTPEFSGPETKAKPSLFEGVCEGRILLAARGTHGFGYDPLFQPLGYEQSFAELGEVVKNQISHRARALAKLKAWFNSQPTNQDLAPGQASG